MRGAGAPHPDGNHFKSNGLCDSNSVLTIFSEIGFPVLPGEGGPFQNREENVREPASNNRVKRAEGPPCVRPAIQGKGTPDG